VFLEQEEFVHFLKWVIQATLFALAAQFEAACPWFDRRPSG
jgi:hypothetical protein